MDRRPKSRYILTCLTEILYLVVVSSPRRRCAKYSLGMTSVGWRILQHSASIWIQLEDREGGLS